MNVQGRGDDHPSRGPHTQCQVDHGGKDVPAHCRRGCKWPCPDASQPPRVGKWLHPADDGCVDRHTCKPPCDLASYDPGPWDSVTMGTTG